MISSKYEYWYAQYMMNGVSVNTLNRLAEADKLTKEELDKMVADRKEKYGY